MLRRGRSDVLQTLWEGVAQDSDELMRACNDLLAGEARLHGADACLKAPPVLPLGAAPGRLPEPDWHSVDRPVRPALLQPDIGDRTLSPHPPPHAFP